MELITVLEPTFQLRLNFELESDDFVTENSRTLPEFADMV